MRPVLQLGLEQGPEPPQLDEEGVLQALGMGSRAGASWPRRSQIGKWDAVHTKFWDVATVLNAGTTELTMFTVPTSQTKGRHLTNLTQGARISSYSAFDVLSLRVELIDDLAAQMTMADAREILYTGMLEILISQNRYMEGPLTQYPAGGGIYGGDSSTTVAATTIESPANNGVPQSDAAMEFLTTVRIPRNVDFQVNLLWPATVTPTIDRQIRITLEGIAWRIKKSKA